MVKPNTSFFRVIADPDLMQEERKLFADRNPLAGKVFATKVEASLARHGMDGKHAYIVVEGWGWPER